MEKPFVKFISDNDRLKYKKSNTLEMDHLGLFLTDDVGNDSVGFKEWILDPRFDFTTSNYASLEKEGDYILMGCETELEGPYLKIHRDELIKILDGWEQFCKTKPKEIIITQEDDGTFKIEAKD